MKMRILTLGSCLVLIALFVVWYGFVLPQDALAAPSGKCCLETGECVEVSSTDCDAMGGVFSGAGTTCDFGPDPDCPIPRGCAGNGESCNADGDCCSNKCKNGKCRGN